LSELQKQLEHDKAEIKRLTEEGNTLEKDIETLTGEGKTIKEILEAYNKALPNLIKELKEGETYADTKMRMVLCAVEHKKGPIDQKIAEYDQKVSEKTAELEQLKAEKAEAERQHEQAKADAKLKEEQFEYWKKLQSKIEEKLSEIQKLKTQIEKEDDLSHAASMYFLTLELQKVLRSIAILCAQDLKTKLYGTWKELGQTKEIVRQKKSALDEITAKVEAAQKVLDELKDKEKRRTKILEKLAVFDQPAPPKNYQAAK
jgi:DNA repair exonuclease SbcCD ATPase subunit